MDTARDARLRTPVALLAIIAVQVLCGAFFIGDLVADLRTYGTFDSFPSHLSLEAAASVSLIAAIVLEARLLRQILRRKAHLEHSLALARAAMQDVIAWHFRSWRLSPSETDVATFLVKGLSIQEIAEMRGCAQGTVKAHLNAIYRKSGTQNRGDLLSVLLDGVMEAPDPVPDRAAGRTDTPPQAAQAPQTFPD
jgi:DNA-binding CsgD family transcriptional regulator